MLIISKFFHVFTQKIDSFMENVQKNWKTDLNVAAACCCINLGSDQVDASIVSKQVFVLCPNIFKILCYSSWIRSKDAEIKSQESNERLQRRKCYPSSADLIILLVQCSSPATVLRSVICILTQTHT